MACFGCSCANNVTKDFEEDSVKTSSLKKKKPWISWSRPKKFAAKTVPVSVSMSGNLDSISKSHLLKVDKVNVVPSKKHRRPAGVNANNKAYKKKSGTVKEIILENSEISHFTSLAKDGMHDKKHSSSRKKETNRNGSSSPPDNEIPTATNRADLTSLPPRREKKTKSMSGENGDDNVITSVKNQNKEALDSIVGMWVIVVILVFIIFWGKFCAILCTSACFYMIPRLRTAADTNAMVNNALESDVLNLNSDEHKKKVVLEGLLQRNRRCVIGVS